MDPIRILTIVTIAMFAVLAVITVFISIQKRTMFAKLGQLLEDG